MAINTMRYGWNTRGGSSADHLRMQRQALIAQRDAAGMLLLQEIGVDDFVAWVDENIPDDLPITTVIDMLERELDSLVTCTCPPDFGGSCKACKHSLSKLYTEALPF